MSKFGREVPHIDASIIAVPAAQIIISTAIEEFRKALILFKYVRRLVFFCCYGLVGFCVILGVPLIQFFLLVLLYNN